LLLVSVLGVSRPVSTPVPDVAAMVGEIRKALRQLIKSLGKSEACVKASRILLGS
jgi:hypothetical protein